MNKSEYLIVLQEKVATLNELFHAKMRIEGSLREIARHIEHPIDLPVYVLCGPYAPIRVDDYLKFEVGVSQHRLNKSAKKRMLNDITMIEEKIHSVTAEIKTIGENNG